MYLITCLGASSKSRVSYCQQLIQFVEKSPFTLDIEGGFVHFFKQNNDKMPY
jgi:hypothetical protein